MFVRNNTTCPNCGKSRTFDIFAKSSSPEGVVMVAECYHCSFQWEGLILVEMVRYVLLSVAKRHPAIEDLKITRKWRDHVYLRLNASQQIAVLSLCFNFFYEGEVCGDLLSDCPSGLSTLAGWLVGDTQEAQRFNMLNHLFNRRAVQPLAS